MNGELAGNRGLPRVPYIPRSRSMACIMADSISMSSLASVSFMLTSNNHTLSRNVDEHGAVSAANPVMLGNGKGG